jgi:dethiobiotin synthetase
MRSLFITGTDTNVGKTWITCTLLQHFAEQGVRAGGYKPVCSGAEFHPDGTPHWADVDALRTHSPLNPPEDLVCPQRFFAPLAPNLAAELENATVDEPLLEAGVAAWHSLTPLLLIEGAGGLYCPLTNQITVLDLILRLQTPAIVVAANRLGCISHSRMTTELLTRHNIPVLALILNDVHSSEDSGTDQSLRHNAAQLKHWIPQIPILTCSYNSHSLQLFTPGSQPLANLDEWLNFAAQTPALR